MPPISVLIKPASSKCNMRCRYCFYHALADNRQTADYGFMALETIETIVKKVLDFASVNATFSFQGGEPTLCGLDFFRNVVEFQKKYNVNQVSIQNCLQTNGLLIDEAWCRFLHDHNFLVGLSLDGFEKLNDGNRRDAKGEGTFGRIMKTAAMFDRYSVDYNILFVVTNSTAQSADKAYDFFASNKFNFLQFIPCIDPPGCARGKHAYSLTPEKYTFFLKHFFDRWQKDLLRGRDISVRYFDNLVRMVIGMPPETCSMTGVCSCQFVFEADGRAYPCDFYVNDDWCMGDIKHDDIMALYQSENSARFMSASQQIMGECRLCSVYKLCRGGCRRDRDDNVTGELGLNYFCKSYKDFLQYAIPKLVELAQHITSKNQST